MKKIKGILTASVALCLLLAASFIFSSCSGGGGIKVSLYNGEELYKTVNVKNGQQYEFGVPSKTGYSFLGWYSDKEGGSPYTDTNGNSAGMVWKAENSADAHAHWEANRYKLTFDYCGATAANTVADISAIYDSKITDKFPVPEKSGSSFIGWFTAAENGKQITDAKGNLTAEAEVYNASVYEVSEEGTTLYAHWGAKTVTYLFNTDGTAVKEVTYPIGTVLTELPSSIKDNYCFASWCFDQTNLSPMSFPYTIPDNADDYVNLYASFIPATIDVLQFTTISSTGDREYEVTYSGDAKKLIIPDSYYGKKVTSVRRIESATVEEIVLPQTVNQFVNGAFKDCESLKKINIPYAVKLIPEKLFSGCVSLEEIKLPEKTEEIGKEAFAECKKVNSIYIPATVTVIGNGVFKNMTALEGFAVAEGNTRYIATDGVLYSQVGTSTYLVHYPAMRAGDTYIINETAVKIMDYAFSGAQISTISVGGKISTIGKGAFENCQNLVSASISGSAVNFSIDADAFKGCSNLKALKIEYSKVPTLNSTAFTGVSDTFSVYVTSNMVRNYQTAAGWRDISSNIYSLGTIFGDFAVAEVADGYTIRQYFGTAKDVVIPEILNANKIVAISENAFSLSGMETVTVSENVTDIGENAFRNCANLKAIILECEPPSLGSGAFTGVASEFTVYIKNSTDILDAYKSAEGWSAMADKIWSYQSSVNN